jgi:hypothetical protein
MGFALTVRSAAIGGGAASSTGFLSGNMLFSSVPAHANRFDERGIHFYKLRKNIVVGHRIKCASWTSTAKSFAVHAFSNSTGGRYMGNGLFRNATTGHPGEMFKQLKALVLGYFSGKPELYDCGHG